MDKILSELRTQIQNYISGKRYSHTLAVERECASLAEQFGLNDAETLSLRISALLHDITKEKKLDQQLLLCDEFSIAYTDTDLASPKIFHSKTAACIAKRDFPNIADSRVCDNIRYHTVGRENMTLSEKLLYLADYIEDTRDFDDCIKLRKYFYTSSNRSEKSLIHHLDETLIISFDMTLKNLIADGMIIAPETVASRNFLIKNMNA